MAKIVYATFPESYYEILESFAKMKSTTVEDVVEQAVLDFIAMLWKLPVVAFKEEQNFGFADFLRDSDCAAHFGLSGAGDGA